MSVIHAPGKPRFTFRVLLFPGVLLVLFLALLFRLWYVQVAIAPELRERIDNTREASRFLPAPRGLIYDRHGKLIAGVQDQLVLTAEAGIVLKHPEVLRKVAYLLSPTGSDEERLLRKTKDGVYRPKSDTAIYAGLPLNVAAKIIENANAFQGLKVRSQPIRSYPDPVSFSHMLGYVWVPSQGDLDRAKKEGRQAADLVGKSGLEYEYESQLMGVDGEETFQLTSDGERGSSVSNLRPTPGTQLVLSIDADLQKIAVGALSGRRGAVVAIEPETGEILCLASRPAFDLRQFKNGISRQDFDALNNNPEHPFINRATNSAFAPGSTFKIVTTVAAMRSGKFNPSQTVYCSGGYRLGKQFFRCLGHHGAINFSTALEKSCNTYFSDLAVKVGKDELRKAALDMGFFSKSGLDLPSERSGLIPTDDWLRRVGKKWVPGYTVLTGIGQGDVLATPVQMANLACFVANEGTTYRPHLVKAFRGHNTSQVAPEVVHQVDLPAGDWRQIKDAMVGVVDHGTAAGSRIPGLAWGGKTGSAEVHGQAKTNSWFIGFAPAIRPKIAICVMVEAVGHGSEYAAPIARRVVESYLRPASAFSKSSSAR